MGDGAKSSSTTSPRLLMVHHLWDHWSSILSRMSTAQHPAPAPLGRERSLKSSHSRLVFLFRMISGRRVKLASLFFAFAMISQTIARTQSSGSPDPHSIPVVDG